VSTVYCALHQRSDRGCGKYIREKNKSLHSEKITFVDSVFWCKRGKRNKRSNVRQNVLTPIGMS
jgi:hypothetical protein